MKFKFRAVTSSGEHYEGEKEAPDKLSLYQEIKKNGDTIISASEVEKKSNRSGLKFAFLSFFSRVGTADKIVFAKNLGSMLEAGLPLTKALSVLERQAKSGKLKSVFVKIQDDVNKGDSLSSALSNFPTVFPELFISMVKSGEESGSISNALKTVSAQMEKTHLLVKKLRGAMIYPAIVVTAMIIISILMLIFLVPVLTETFAELEVELPLSTRIIIYLSGLLKDHTVLSISSIVVFIVLLFTAMKTRKGKRVMDYLFLHLPIISGITKESNSAKTTRTLSSLLSSGVDFLVAIKITKDVVQNSYYRTVLGKAEEKVRTGGTISSIFLEEQKLYPPLVGEMAGIGEETGKLSEMLSNTADFFEEEVDQKTKNMSTVIEPLLIVFMGLFVGIFAVSMLGPIYSLAGAI